MSAEEIDSKPWHYINDLWEQVTVIEAREMLSDIKVARSAYMKNKDFSELKKELIKKARI